MKALAWHGKHDVRCDSVPDPKIEHPHDAIIKVTACAICGSDLHIYNGIIPRMQSGDVLGHETALATTDMNAKFTLNRLQPSLECPDYTGRNAR